MHFGFNYLPLHPISISIAGAQMDLPINVRLKSARILKGISLQELAQVLDKPMSRQALHKYEQGIVTPNLEMLKMLSKALGVPVEHFYKKSSSLDIGKIEFRKLHSMPAREELSIIEQTKDILERYLEVEAILGIVANFANPLKSFKQIISYSDVNLAAMKVREAWNMGIDPIANVVDLLESHAVKIAKVSVNDSIDGFQTWINESIPVIGYNKQKLDKQDRIRFTLLHELCHLLLGDKFGEATSDQIEKFCNHFAGVMLIPDSALFNELGEHRNQILIQELGAIKRKYGISMQALLMRIKICGILNEHAVKQLFNAFKVLGWSINEPYDFQGFEQSDRMLQLVYRALAEKLITSNKAKELGGKDFTLAH